LGIQYDTEERYGGTVSKETRTVPYNRILWPKRIRSVSVPY